MSLPLGGLVNRRRTGHVLFIWDILNAETDDSIMNEDICIAKIETLEESNSISI